MTEFDPIKFTGETAPQEEISVMSTREQLVQQYSMNGYRLSNWDVRINKEALFDTSPEYRVERAACIEGVGYSSNTIASIENLIAVLQRVVKDARGMS